MSRTSAAGGEFKSTIAGWEDGRTVEYGRDFAVLIRYRRARQSDPPAS